ncbi:MAG: bifunctional phosphopantothenoylcysteine decarboxylase/phosphopantothenate--cysteine ligase CoaBC [bacterium]|nr:bifunctional phosphopantothenoylcysteine decarboxylase/phosphopantothenate--cysteine ligase CoaBC [bacterium]
MRRCLSSLATMFENKNILVGVTGGIAAYKVPDIIRAIRKNNSNVRAVLTASAAKFVTPLTLATLTEQPVLMEMFIDESRRSTIHIDSARWADAILICPATANTMGKIAHGIADNLLTTLIMAATSPVIFCPAMNKEMVANTFYQQNLKKLQQAGYHFVDSEPGELACGEFGAGRLADKMKILARLRKVLFGNQRLVGKKVLVTAGRTEEKIDPVRYISNYSTGKMGFAVAEAAWIEEAEVTLITGPTELTTVDEIKLIRVESSEQMMTAVDNALPTHDVVVMAAAVADFKPKHFQEQKIKKSTALQTFELQQTTDILKTVGEKKGEKIIVGFAIETENELSNAEKKMREKNLDFIVLNNPNVQGAGFGYDTNVATILDRMGGREKLPLMSKKKLAEIIINKIVDFRKDR